jgi:hypothetical protein
MRNIRCLILLRSKKDEYRWAKNDALVTRYETTKQKCQNAVTIRFAPIYTFRTIYAVITRNLLKHRPENLGRITAEVTT